MFGVTNYHIMVLARQSRVRIDYDSTNKVILLHLLRNANFAQYGAIS